MSYFKNLLDLLKIEKDEDHKNYLRQTESLSVTDRRANGLTWYPIAIRGTEPSRGDYLSVEVERTTHQDISHQFRFGVSAVLFSNHDPKHDRLEGTISYQGGNRLKITLYTEELPDWCSDGKLGVELLFDNNSYDEMQKALKLAAAQREQPESGLIRILTGDGSPSFTDEPGNYQLDGLNSSQQSAVKMIMAARDLAIVHGPPGTGKTTTLVRAIKTLVMENKEQILVVAPSNTAVDLLSESLHNEGLNVLRIGNPARVSANLMALTLDAKIAEHSYNKEAKKLKKQASEYKNMAHKYKRNFGKAERDQRKALFDEAHKIMREVDKAEQFIIEDLLAKAQVITATLVGANHYTVRDKKYAAVVIDEAGQAIEPACWVPILKAEKVIMAGDHFQLPPTIKSAEAAKKGLATTLLEKCVSMYPEAVTLLEEQYRMNTAIMGFSAMYFYQDRLKAHGSVANRLLFPDDKPLTFVDTAGSGFDDKLEGTSSVNPEEAVFLIKHLTLLIEKLDALHSPANFPSIAVISPYKEQIRVLNELFKNSPALQLHADRISVNTIDSFQGQERDVVYISMTRSNSSGEIGFLADTRRMNVAMTRARKKLVVIGDSSTLSSLPFYHEFIAYAEQVNGYESAWDYAGI